MQICHWDVDTFRKSVVSTRKRPISKRHYCRRLFPFRDRDVLILYISEESQDCLHVDFECFQISTMAIFEREVYELLNVLTRPGDKHDEKISNCSSRLFDSVPSSPSEAGSSSLFCRESHDLLTFLTTRLPISWFLVKYHSEMKCFFVQ